jgi:hypothetical protein
MALNNSPSKEPHPESFAGGQRALYGAHEKESAIRELRGKSGTIDELEAVAVGLDRRDRGFAHGRLGGAGQLQHDG